MFCSIWEMHLHKPINFLQQEKMNFSVGSVSLMFKSVTTSCYWEKIKVVENLALLNRITYWVACLVRTDHGNDLLNNKGNAN